jgi:hypothetical protein
MKNFSSVWYKFLVCFLGYCSSGSRTCIAIVHVVLLGNKMFIIGPIFLFPFYGSTVMFIPIPFRPITASHQWLCKKDATSDRKCGKIQ